MTTLAAPKLIEILLVEDSQTDILMTREALESARVLNRLHVVEDGEQAMDFLRARGAYTGAQRPGLILLDLNLPKKSGREVLEEIKSDDDLKTIPVVILTTSKAEEDILRSYGLHANCYVTKPVEFSTLAGVIREIHQFWFGVVTLPPL
jgi:CheY-like chemotaxis protein